MQNIITAHVVVTGRVQGIGYRWFVQNIARNLKLAGWVRNLPDGGVEIEAEGEKNTIALFLDSLKNGHNSAIVSDMKTDLHEAVNNFNGRFEIKF